MAKPGDLDLEPIRARLRTRDDINIRTHARQDLIALVAEVMTLRLRLVELEAQLDEVRGQLAADPADGEPPGQVPGRRREPRT